MNFIVLEGQLGGGKTLGAVIFANYVKALSSDVTLYSNFGMYHARPFRSLYDFYEITQNFSSDVVLDEAHIDLDARSFNTNHVKFLSMTSFYLRKVRTTFIMTSPLFDNLDSRIRGITNMLVKVRNDKKYFYYDCWDVQSDRFLRTLKIKKDNAFSMNLYDTHAIVSPIEMPENKKEFDIFLETLADKSEQYYNRSQAERESLQALEVAN